MSRSTSGAETLLAYGLWLALSGLAAWLLWTFYSVLMLGSTIWLTSDLPRPSGWTIRTSVAISKMLILILGSFWLGYVMWLEREMNQAAQEGSPISLALRRAGVMGGLLVLFYGLAYLLG